MDIKIIQQNVCGQKLHKGEWGEYNLEILIDNVNQRAPDILLLSEFCYKDMINIVNKYFSDYEFIVPKKLSEKNRNSGSLFACCFMAYKKEKFTFKPVSEEITDVFPFRYICGNFLCNGADLFKILLIYIPQTYNTFLDRVEDKRKMLKDIKKFVKININESVFIGGDMNSDIDNNSTSCIEEFTELYNLLIDTDIYKNPTWRKKRLDYALISKNENISAETYSFETNSDHKGLETILHIQLC